MNTDRETLLSEIRSKLFPTAVPLADRLLVDWVARARQALPDQAALSLMQSRIEDEIYSNMRSAYNASVSKERLSEARPRILLVRLDELHLLVRIDMAAPDATIGDTSAIAQYGSLQAIHRDLVLDDLQGLPAKWWFFLRSVRENADTY